MAADTLTVALISECFYQDDGAERLHARLRQAQGQGAQLAVLPELAVLPWVPATKIARDEDAEAPRGERHEMQARAARDVGIGLVGGAIVQRPESGQRFNTALVFDAHGELRGTFEKCHIPEEPGFWESSHYEPGESLAPVFDDFSMPFGVQICSDVNRPEGSHLLGALGAEAVLNPRSTERATYERWRHVFIANALTSCLYVLSVNRPAPENGVLIGGPSIAVSPSGEVLLETEDPVGIVTLDRNVVREARTRYPGYLSVRAEMYAEAWRHAAPAATASAQKT